MPSRISQNQIVDAVLDGIEEAQETYEDWSGGDWLADTAEHVMYGFVARSIMGIPGTKFLEIEPRTKDTVKATGANKRGKLAKGLRPQGHIDMCLWWANNHPRAIIEIKHNVYNYEVQCDGDITRILSSLWSPNTSLQFGVFAFYSSFRGERIKKAKDILVDRLDTINSRIESACGKSFTMKNNQRIHEVKNGAWSAGCIVIKPS